MQLGAAVLVALSGTVAACGDDDEDSGSSGSTTSRRGGGGGTVKLYSSLPLQGASRPQSEDVIKGIELALKQRDGKAGDFTIKYESLDDATAAAGQWDAAQTKANARKVAQDDTAIAYIGEFNSGASANSIPTTQRGRHPAGLAVEHRARPDEVRRRRRAGRAGQVLPDGQAHLRARRPDRHDPGRRAGAVHAGRGRDQGLHPRRQRGVRQGRRREHQDRGRGAPASRSRARTPGTARPRTTALWPRRSRRSGADAVFTGGIIDNNAPQLYKDLHAAMPDAKLFGPDGVATVDFTKEIPAGGPGA